ncbi:MAG: gliding motility protein GldM [Parafilimonas sp.]
MALPKEPRQKMINLMYLVLTAMLALNVSAEILNAFKTVNNSLTIATNTIERRNENIFKSFEELKNDPKTAEKAAVWAPKAEHAKQMAEELNTYIGGLKKEIIDASDFNPKDGSFIEDDLESPTRVMTDPGTKGKELHDRLEKFRNDLLAIHPDIKKTFEHILPIDLVIPKTNNKANENNWSASYFYMTPSIAAVTILSKFQNDVKTSEAMVVDYCHQQVGAVKVIFDTYKPLVGQSSNYLMPGQELTITAGIGAFSSSAKPTISIDGAGAPLNANGVAEYKMTVGGPGSYTKNVSIKYVNQSTGKDETATFPVAYTVGSPTGASVSADAVKVLYVGLDNPLSVSGGNVGDEKVSASMTNGSLTKTGPGKYIARPGKAGTKAVITVTVEGKPTPFEFRVKDVPDPVAKVGQNKGGRMRVNDFKAQFGIRADLENFVFEGVRFNVTGYIIVLNGAGFSQMQYQQVQGDSFDPVRTLIEKAKPNTSIILDEIRATGPGGTRKLVPIAFTLY